VRFGFAQGERQRRACRLRMGQRAGHRPLAWFGWLALGCMVTACSQPSSTAPTTTQPTGAIRDASSMNPPQVVVLGDSSAATLWYALQATAPAGTTVVDGALFGCALAIGTNASFDPPHPQMPMVPSCNSATPSPRQWPTLDAEAVRNTAPGDVILFVAGVWETEDLLIGGQWTNILAPSFQSNEISQMRRVVQIGTAHGAHFEFATMPANAAGAAFHHAPVGQDSPTRRSIYNRLITKVAGEFPGKASVVDYAGILSPGGVYRATLDGVQVRTLDGVHTPSYAPGNPFAGNANYPVAEAFYRWLGPRIWPLIIAPSATHRRA
jgi:hypothetical protein